MNKIEGLVPDIGTKGKYILIDPWTTDDSTIYSCERISSIVDFKLTNKVDVLKEIYLDNGLTKEDYIYAVKNNIKIVTLKTDKRIQINIPDNYIKKMPDMGFVGYRQYIISLNLKLLPDNIDLTSTIEELVSVVSKTLNVEVTPKVHNYISNKFVSWDRYIELEETRLSGVKPYQTQWERIAELEKRNKALSDVISELEDALTIESSN